MKFKCLDPCPECKIGTLIKEVPDDSDLKCTVCGVFVANPATNWYPNLIYGFYKKGKWGYRDKNGSITSDWRKVK